MASLDKIQTHWFNALIVRAKKERLGYPLTHFPNPVVLLQLRDGMLVAETGIENYRGKLTPVVDTVNGFGADDVINMIDVTIGYLRSLVDVDEEQLNNGVMAFCLVGPDPDKDAEKIKEICEKHKIVGIMSLFTWSEVVADSWTAPNEDDDTAITPLYHYQGLAIAALPIEFEYYSHNRQQLHVTLIEFADACNKVSQEHAMFNILETPDDMRGCYDFLIPIMMQADLTIVPQHYASIMQGLECIEKEDNVWIQARKKHFTRNKKFPIIVLGEDGHIVEMPKEPIRHVVCIDRDTLGALDYYCPDKATLRQYISVRSLVNMSEEDGTLFTTGLTPEIMSYPSFWKLTQVGIVRDTNMHYVEYEITPQEMVDDIVATVVNEKGEIIDNIVQPII